ncbi:GtrA family protein [Schaalia sp. 19OD2882]|uniref:GtrA family protein n=1 Tax=Schaalia sp. 19OD2882 TaxID=2794089 RepID=UPI001C1F154E|nr:GtrA family protein [Schaalia sp. 19OD2882]QWW19342.1 GtrA family protein [Schaalia sp. 19OD2882]
METTTSLTTTALATAARFGRQLRYVASSLSSTAVDQVVLLVLNSLVGGLLLPVVLARVTSCTVNYTLNRRVFATKGDVLGTAVRYAVVQGAVMCLAYMSINALVSAGTALWAASILANASLFVVNYLGQTYFVFSRRGVAGMLRDARSALLRVAEGGIALVTRFDQATARPALQVA